MKRVLCQLCKSCTRMHTCQKMLSYRFILDSNLRGFDFSLNFNLIYCETKAHHTGCTHDTNILYANYN